MSPADPPPPPPPPPPSEGSGTPGAPSAGDAPPRPSQAATRKPPPPPSERPTQAQTDQLPTTGQAPPPPPPPPPPAGTPPPCPNCGAPTTEGQQVCLECGHDLTRSYRRAPGRGVWVAAGVAAVLALGVGAGFAIGALTNDKQKKDVAKASTSTTNSVPPVTAVPPPTTTTPTVPTTPTTTDVPPATATPPTTPTIPTTPGVPPASTPPSTAPSTPSTPSPGGEIATWPAGTTAYTVVLISAATHKQANAKAREAKSRGIDAGVLHSNDYSSLNPGYWVVFAGQYPTAAAARSHIDEYASKGFAGGYPRQVKK